MNCLDCGRAIEIDESFFNDSWERFCEYCGWLDDKTYATREEAENAGR
jgi:hypothetical protein